MSRATAKRSPGKYRQSAALTNVLHHPDREGKNFRVPFPESCEALIDTFLVAVAISRHKSHFADNIADSHENRKEAGEAREDCEAVAERLKKILRTDDACSLFYIARPLHQIEQWTIVGPFADGWGALTMQNLFEPLLNGFEYKEGAFTVTNWKGDRIRMLWQQAKEPPYAPSKPVESKVLRTIAKSEAEKAAAI